jgi:hypothetical protein
MQKAAEAAEATHMQMQQVVDQMSDAFEARLAKKVQSFVR